MCNFYLDAWQELLTTPLCSFATYLVLVDDVLYTRSSINNRIILLSIHIALTVAHLSCGTMVGGCRRREQSWARKSGDVAELIGLPPPSTLTLIVLDGLASTARTFSRTQVLVYKTATSDRMRSIETKLWSTRPSMTANSLLFYIHWA